MRHSAKNQAENVMIVDMVRNDLGRLAEPGSVEARARFTTERYESVWQLTSTVTARTRAGWSQILAKLFPAASITGVPKVSTMRIITELETTPRHLYTGCIGYVGPGRRARFNVAIRTLVMDRETGRSEYGVGGGVVWDSTAEGEYAEAMLKANALTVTTPPFALFETLLWTPAQGYFLRARHVRRLLTSADYFGFVDDRVRIEEYLEALAKDFKEPRRVRLVLAIDGGLTHEEARFEPRPSTTVLAVRLAAKPVNSRDVFLFHKTTHRAVYEQARASVPACDEVLLHNEQGELTEFTLGNLVVESAGQRWTPPVECGLLAGTFRAHLLETGQIRERKIRVEEIGHWETFYRINSVRAQFGGEGGDKADLGLAFEVCQMCRQTHRSPKQRVASV